MASGQQPLWFTAASLRGRPRRTDYEDLDKAEPPAAAATSNPSYTKAGVIGTSDERQRAKILSMSDTAIHLTPAKHHGKVPGDVNGGGGGEGHSIPAPLNRTASCEYTHGHSNNNNNGSNSTDERRQSTLSLGNGNIRIGSICLLRNPYLFGGGDGDDNRSQGSSSQRSLALPNEAGEAGEEPSTSRYTVLNDSGTARSWGRKQNVLLVGYVLVYVAYLSVGGLSFRLIETPHAVQATGHVGSVRDGFLLKYPQIKDEDLEEFLRAIITANDRGISPLKNASNEMNWSFGQALFFSSTVITTIGYGRVTPLSQTGKIFCMIYAAIGIPLTLVLLSAIVERMLVPANWFLGTLNSKLGHLYKPFNIRVLHLTLIVVGVALLFFAIPTAVFAYIEPAWGALDAFYYCFISLTTIGLGDYVPGEGVASENRSIYKMFITGYLILGLIAMMLVLTIFYDIPQLNLGQLFTESVNGGEKEKLRLSSNNAPCYSGTSSMYMPQRDEDTRAVVRIRPHHDDSPSPDEPSSAAMQSDPMKMP